MVRSLGDVLNAETQGQKPTLERYASDGDVEYDCEGCHDAKFVGYATNDIRDPLFGKARVCQDCKPPSDTARGVPRRFAGSSFEGFDLTKNPSMEPAFKAAERVAKGEQATLFLYGRAGIGKTHLAVAVLQEWRRRDGAGLFYEVPELLAYLRRCIGDDEDETPDMVIVRLSSPDFLLVLDDLGAHSQTEWAEEQLFRLLNRRYTEYAPTIITANVGVENIDQRIRSRYREGLVPCEGKDQR